MEEFAGNLENVEDPTGLEIQACPKQEGFHPLEKTPNFKPRLLSV